MFCSFCLNCDVNYIYNVFQFKRYICSKETLSLFEQYCLFKASLTGFRLIFDLILYILLILQQTATFSACKNCALN